jgi:hypothetical protein
MHTIAEAGAFASQYGKDPKRLIIGNAEGNCVIRDKN